MSATCKAALKAMTRNDDDCPIIPDKIKFNIFSHYMLMKKGKNLGVYLSTTRCGSIHIALTHMYLLSGKDMDQ